MHKILWIIYVSRIKTKILIVIVSVRSEGNLQNEEGTITP